MDFLGISSLCSGIPIPPLPSCFHNIQTGIIFLLITQKQKIMFEKIYIGKGKKVENLEIVKVKLSIEELQKMIKEAGTSKNIYFEIANMKHADQYENTHTCYWSKKVEEVAEEIAGKSGKKK